MFTAMLDFSLYCTVNDIRLRAEKETFTDWSEEVEIEENEKNEFQLSSVGNKKIL